MKLYITFLVIIFVGLGAYYFVSSGLYPVAFVNGSFISAKTFKRYAASAVVYYQNAAAVYGNDIIPANPNAILEDIQRATLDKLIEDRLIYQGLKDLVANSEERVKSQLPKVEAKAIEAIYGLSRAEFEEMVLKPQARREILENYINQNGGSFNKWLKKARESARVLVLLPKFRWTGGAVEVQ